MKAEEVQYCSLTDVSSWVEPPSHTHGEAEPEKLEYGDKI